MKTPRKTSPSSTTLKPASRVNTSTSFDAIYPTIAEWVESYGWIEIGQDDYSRSMVRALNEGGTVWEGKTRYAAMDELWRDLEKALKTWHDENG